MSSSNSSSEPSSTRPTGLQAMLAHLKDMVQSLQQESPEKDEPLPSWDTPVPPVKQEPETQSSIPLALPVTSEELIPSAEPIPVAEPVVPSSIPDTLPPPSAEKAPPVSEPTAETTAELEITAVPAKCRVCGSAWRKGHASCADCGYYFTTEDIASPVLPAVARAANVSGILLHGRYEQGPVLIRRGNVTRYRALDHGRDSGPVPVIILCETLPPDSPADKQNELDNPPDSEILPVIEAQIPSLDTTLPMPRLSWPNLTWERDLLRSINHSAFPVVVESFTEGNVQYLIEEVPAGRPLWSAWDDPEASADQRFGWLVQIAEALYTLHRYGAIFDGIRPDIFIITPNGQARFCDLSSVLPFPLPADALFSGSLYSAPELITGKVDARADLYSFGALLYALHVGRELSESDFDRPGYPKPFIPYYPDVHPAFGRLISKTFRREVEARFPTEEASREDITGFQELIHTLNVLRRTFDNVRLEIASWTTTGMVRHGNEDAFALLHACESRQDDFGESALLLLADGMGGYEAGEVAAALAIQSLRQYLVAREPFTSLAGASHFPSDALSTASRPEGHAPAPLDVEVCKQTLRSAMKEANRQVYTAARTPGTQRRGMGCTAEAVYLNGRYVVVGHVGDSRTYHLHEGKMLQLTRDQTLVTRLVELGTLTAEEAETHPRRNELQQAIGGQPDVEPDLYSSPLTPGDWVVVCSDGLTNHLSANELKLMLQSEAQSAEMAARRLVNFANVKGAADNVTVVVVRIT